MEGNREMATKKSSLMKKPVATQAVSKAKTANVNAKPVVASSVTKAVVAKPAARPAPTKESNLKKLAESPIIADFVKAKDGCWNHQDWLTFLSDLKKNGCDPIDPDQVGLLLEEKKAKYLASKQA